MRTTANSSTVLITIAIPTYNNSGTIARTIESCLAQTEFDNCEVLVVNNASTDDTDKVIHHYAQDNPCLHVITNEATVSMYENHNIALNHAKGRYLLFCHSDDALDHDAIAILKAHLASRNYPKRYVCWGHSLFRDYNSMLSLHGYLTGQLFAGEDAAKPFLICGLTPSGTCYSSDVIDFGGFVECSHRLAPSDSSTMVYLALNGFRFEMYQQLIFHRTSPSTAVASTKPSDALDAYCDTYSHLMERVSLAELLMLVRLRHAPKAFPLFFMFFAAAHLPDQVIKELIKRLLRTPWIIRHRLFWKVLFKALRFRKNGLS